MNNDQFLRDAVKVEALRLLAGVLAIAVLFGSAARASEWRTLDPSDPKELRELGMILRHDKGLRGTFSLYVAVDPAAHPQMSFFVTKLELREEDGRVLGIVEGNWATELRPELAEHSRILIEAWSFKDNKGTALSWTIVIPVEALLKVRGLAWSRPDSLRREDERRVEADKAGAEEGERAERASRRRE